jgi:RNA-directed DNA polymerase
VIDFAGVAAHTNDYLDVLFTTASLRRRGPGTSCRTVNGFLRGWAGYFRYGNSARFFEAITRYALARLSLFVAKRHQMPTSYGWKMVAYQSPNRMGLITFDGCVIAPRPNRP